MADLLDLIPWEFLFLELKQIIDPETLVPVTALKRSLDDFLPRCLLLAEILRKANIDLP
jgi:hypothetical protein